MADLSKFYIVNDDGYPSLAYYDSPESEVGDHVAFAEAGTTLASLVRAAEKYAERRGPDVA